jgi:hypothetical protein
MLNYQDIIRTKKHLFASESDGGLYDTRESQWYEKPALRPVYSRHYQQIESMHQLKACLRAGQFAFPGGYPMFFMTHDGGVLSFESVREEWRTICRDSTLDSCWLIVGLCINYEDESLYCDHSNKPIESAYGESVQ